MPTLSDDESPSATFPMRVAARLTGVAPERMRAWEARYGAIEPLRSKGGTRRYTYADLERLRLLRRVIEAGGRIRDVARLDCAALEERLAALSGEAQPLDLAELFDALERMDANALRRLLVAERDARGVVAFARDYVLPLAFEIGSRWAQGTVAISAEHMATSIMRSMLVEALDGSERAVGGPPIVFATPTGERHDLGLLVAALIAQEAAARPIFVGADVPDEDLVECVRASRAEGLALGFVTSSAEQVVSVLRRLRRALPEDVAIWAGGSGIRGCAPVTGVDRVENLDQLAAYVLSLTPGVRAEARARAAAPALTESEAVP